MSEMMILQTKLHIPTPRAGLVSRPHLLKGLDRGLARKLTLVSAPAGFGKTTLLAEWVAQLQTSRGEMPDIAWLSLDAADNDPARFLSHLTAALGAGNGTLGRTAVSAFQSAQLPSVLSPLMNQIASADRHTLLVLDDYHVITEPVLHKGMTFMLDHLPPTFHLIVLTRRDPPLPLARLRARDQLNEIRALDLRFSIQETAAFLNREMGLSLSVEELAVLEKRTEGWAVGLHLAALALMHQEDAHAFVQSFAGDDRYVVDYLAEEVLADLPKRVRDFLLETSILARLNASLCEVVTGQNDAQSKLEELEATNLFIVPLDNTRSWFRYHHLFADFLLARLQRKRGREVPELHRRAASWYQEQGTLTEAVPHALVAQDDEWAANLVEQCAQNTFIRGEYTTLLGWLDALPSEIVYARPRLCLAYGWTSLLAGKLSEVEDHLRPLERLLASGASGLDEPELEILRGNMWTLRGELACSMGEVSKAAEYARRALEFLPEEEAFLRGVNAINMTLNIVEADISQQHVEETHAALVEAANVSKKAGDMQGTFYALGLLGRIQMSEGKLLNAARTFDEAIGFAEREYSPQSLPPVSGLAYVGLGEVQHEWNDLEEARRNIQKGVELGESGEDDRTRVLGYVELARLHVAQGSFESARGLIDEANKAAQRSDISWVVTRVRAGQVRFWLAEGNLEAAGIWARGCGLESGDAIGYSREGEYLALARVYLALGEHERALMLLDWMLGLMEQLGLWGVVIEVECLRAIGLRAMGEERRALRALGRALRLADPERYVRTFLDEGEPMKNLLVRANSRGIAKTYVGELLEAFRDAPSSGGVFERQPKPVPSRSPLTAREAEVLELISRGLTNKSIAKELVITVGTVKRHTHSIYNKLDVGNRTEAVARAGELGIL